ncbi:TMEM175 family protein [Salisaeta longa]|uniref:TMEM175 family protein n=1 Tax=Salisaeta longa TaxID=503170 RepID=UPI00048BC5BD|nr:TMEM175 family protein [Salisaeta longa]
MATPRDAGGFRLRGLDTTRIETFTDAAFAFALTLLVISLDPPTTMQALTGALVHVPGFVFSATLLMVFWNGHHRWSRRYGLDDGTSIVLSCLLVFTILVFVYPLRYMARAVTGATASLIGLPIGPDIRTLGITSVHDVNLMFVIYGIGFMFMSMTIALLNLHAWRHRHALALDETERIETRMELGTWCILFIAALLSTITAAAFPNALPIGGWPYALLGIVMPIYRRHMRQGTRRLRTGAPSERAGSLSR